MRRHGPVLIALAAVFAGPGAAEHDVDCTPQRADPSTYTMVVSPFDGRVWYIEERGTGLPPVPLSGYLVGDHTWVYEETFAIFAPDGSLQRGGFAGHFGCFPGEGSLCIVHDEDPINDEHCGHGADSWTW